MMIELSYIDVDSFARAVFEGNNGKLYKTTTPVPVRGILSLGLEEKFDLLTSLHTTNCFEGEPDIPCWNKHDFICLWGTIKNEKKPSNMAAYLCDLNDILKDVDILVAYAPAGKTKKAAENSRTFLRAVSRIRTTVNLMKNDYTPIEAKEGGK